MEKKGKQSASNHSDKGKDNNQAAANNKTQNKANSTKASQKGVAVRKRGGINGRKG